MLMRFVSATCVGALFLLPCALWAQKMPTKPAASRLDLAFTYNAQDSNLTSGNKFWMQGGSVQMTDTLTRRFGLTADLSGTGSGKISPSGAGLTLLTITVGPTYSLTFPRHKEAQRPVRFFGEALAGLANGFSSVFPGTQGAQSTARSLAVKMGGGMDIDLTPRIAVRVLQADWLRTQLPNGASNVQNNLQVGAGIVWHLP
jgi:hypothetical protein